MGRNSVPDSYCCSDTCGDQNPAGGIRQMTVCAAYASKFRRKAGRRAAAAMLTVAAAPVVSADPPVDAQQHCAVATPAQAQRVAEQLFEQASYRRAGECYQAAGNLARANLAFLKALRPESAATERRLAEQRDQTKALLGRVARGLR
jgi:hypothetical protein